MEFNHLNDTRFPNLDNVDVYAYRNDFDYRRWVPNTRIHLLNVLWNGDYSDCVKFDSDTARDEWFDSKFEPETTVSLTANSSTFISNGTVKVPIPYDNACRYNYLVVEIPVMTSPDDMLNYETADGFRRWHFFIDDFASSTPSTTVLTLSLDIWTQFINSVGFNYFMLERGHAPVSASDTDTYLANPIDNSEYLLAPDVNFGGQTVSRSSEFIPFGNCEKYICFASNCAPSQLASMGTVTESGSATFSDPVFSDATAYPDSSNRWGRQYEVSGFGFGSGRSYDGTSTPVGNNLSSNGRVPTSTTVYAIPATDADSFVGDAIETCPMFLNATVACFMVAKELITLGAPHTVAGHVLHECEGSDTDLGGIQLNRSMFSIPERYQRFAKLFTYPYSELEVTDNNGKSATVRIENTGAMRAHGIVSLAYPYLNMRMFITGINGTGSESYEWRDLRGAHDMQMPNGDWYDFCYDMDIPMYALYMDGQTSWEMGSYHRSLSNARNSAIVNYHNSVREANNAMRNSQDTADTNRTSGDASAATAQSNAVNTANTAQTNTGNDADTMSTNHANSRACATDITANNNAAAQANAASHNKQIDSTKTANNELSYAHAVAADAFTLLSSKEENETSIATAGANTFAQIAGVAGNIGAATIAGMGAAGVAGAGAGAMMGAMQSSGSFVGALMASSNATVTAQCNSAVSALQADYNDRNYQATAGTNTKNATYASTENTEVMQHNVNAATSNTARSNSCDASNTGNTANTMKTNAANTRNAQVVNAGNTYSTSTANNARLRDNIRSNSDWTDRAAIAAAQDTLRNTQNQFKAVSDDSRNMHPVQLCPSGGDSAPDYMRTRGVQVKVRTQGSGAIRAAGDEFARFGYNLNQIWEVGSLCLMKHFTYWKASDLWVYDIRETNDSAQESISNIFRNGVTVWSNPDEIGKVNPYDN